MSLVGDLKELSREVKAMVCWYCGKDVEIDEKGMPVGCVNEQCETYRPKEEREFSELLFRHQVEKEGNQLPPIDPIIRKQEVLEIWSSDKISDEVKENFIKELAKVGREITEKELAMKENKTTPKHYHGTAIIDFIEEMKLGFSLGNVVKYVARCGKKNGESELDDLRKARFYLQYHIDRLERERVSSDVDEIVDKAFEGREKALNKDKRYDLEWGVRTCSCGHNIQFPKVSGTQSLRCPKCGELNHATQLYGGTEPLDLHYEKGEWSGFKCSCGKKVTLGKDKRVCCDCGTFVYLTEKKTMCEKEK